MRPRGMSDPSSPQSSTVSVSKLIARYGSRTILQGVDVEVQPGEIRVILGGSGSGKSTLLKHMIGMIRPAGGDVRLLGEDLTQLDESAREKLLRRIGILFQGSALLNSLTVHENVALPLKQDPSLPKDVIDEIVRMKLALVELSHAGQLFPSELSGGMKKRAGLARAMALDPEVLFCDEPSAGLDPITAAQLDKLLIALRDRFKMSVVVVTHELASVELISDRVVMLHKGHIIADGSLDHVRSADHPMVRAFFDRVAELEAPPASVYERLGKEAGSWS